MGRIPDDIAFISLPGPLAQFHHLPEHVPLHASLEEQVREKGYPFADGVKAMEEVLAADPQVPGNYLFRLFVEKWPLWKEAESLLSAGRLPAAIEKLVGILDRDPDCPLTCFQLGFCFRATGELEKSESFYQKALTLAPDAGWIHSNLGRTYQAMGDVKKAASAFWAAREKMPNDLFVMEQLELLGEIVMLPPDPGKPDERSYVKREEYEKILRGRMETVSAAKDLLPLGLQALQARIWETAIAVFDKARESASPGRETDEAELGLGIATLHAGRPREAERWLVGFLERSPDSAVAHVNLFKTYLALEEEDKAWEEIRAAAALAPDDLDVLRQMFLFFENTGREQEGLETLADLAAVDPGCVAPLLLQAQHHDSKNDWTEAESLLKEAVKRSPTSEAVLVYYSSALGKAGRPQEAVDLLKIRRGDMTLALAVNLALALRQAGQREEALKVLGEFKDDLKASPMDRLRAEVLRQEFLKENE